MNYLHHRQSKNLTQIGMLRINITLNIKEVDIVKQINEIKELLSGFGLTEKNSESTSLDSSLHSSIDLNNEDEMWNQSNTNDFNKVMSSSLMQEIPLKNYTPFVVNRKRFFVCKSSDSFEE